METELVTELFSLCMSQIYLLQNSPNQNYSHPYLRLGLLSLKLMVFYCPKGTFVALLMYFTLKTHWMTELSSEMWALSCQSHEAHIPSHILEHRSEPSSVYPNLSLLHISP